MNRIVPLSAVLVSLGLASLDAGPAAAQFRDRGSFGGGYQAPSGNFAREAPGARQPTGDGPRSPGGPRYPRGPGGYGGGYYGGGYGLGVPLAPGYVRGPYYDPYDDDEVIYTRPRPRGPSSVEVLDEGPIQRDQPRGRKPKPGKTAVAKKPVKTKQASGGPVIRPPTPPVPPVVAPPPPPQTAANPPAPQGPSGVPPVDEQRYVPDEVVFEFKPATDPQAIDEVIARNRLERVASWRFRLTDSILYRYRITDGRSVSTVVAALEQDAAVQSAQPNYIYTLQQAAAELKPSDVPEATKASNSGLPPQYAIDVMHVADAHKLANGTNIIVSVIDSGVDTSHAEMKGVVTDTFDAIGGEARPDPHGTAMTGAIAAHGQLTGLAPDAHVVAVRAFAGAGQQAPAKAGAEGTTFHILRGLDWSYERQARIVNMSFAGPKDPALTRMMAAARAKKMILIAAAGNAGPKSAPLYPAADPNVIAVTATDGQNQPYANANRGAYISVASPGVDVLVAAPNGAYDFTTGTSVATAHVSGIAALILQRRPDLDQEAVRKLLVSSGKAIEAQDAEGARLVDAAAAVEAASGTQ